MTNLAETFRTINMTDGLWAPMRWLNERVPYRYTAIFTFDGDTLRNVCLVDKENANITGCVDQAITDSYCFYIHRSGELFSVEKAKMDSRVEGHPKQRSYQCYYGVPLVDSNGKLFGTVCHFDIGPIRVTEEVVTALDDLAPYIAEAAFHKARRLQPIASSCGS